MKDSFSTKSRLFAELTAQEAQTINGGAYWNRGGSSGGGGGGGGGGGADNPPGHT